jgi:uncharacterized protein YbaP (TraB family)
MTGRLLSLSTLALLVCCAPACGQAPDDAKSLTAGPSSVWVVEKDGHRIYLGGTIHLLRAQDYPLPDAFEHAYNSSNKLVFELPPDSEGDGEVVIRMRQMGSYPPGDDLTQHVSDATLKKVYTWAQQSTFPKAAVHRMRPWFLALTIAMSEYQKLGAEPDRGVDQFFEKRAKMDRKPGEGLETVEFQLSIFSNLSDQLQEELLLQTFTEAETMRKDFTELTTAWRKGDAEKLHELLFRDADKYPELMENFLLKRNKVWVKPLLNYLKKGESVFVLVGAGHLGGKGGVLELMKEEGCTVTQLGVPAAAVAK